MLLSCYFQLSFFNNCRHWWYASCSSKTWSAKHNMIFLFSAPHNPSHLRQYLDRIADVQSVVLVLWCRCSSHCGPSEQRLGTNWNQKHRDQCQWSISYISVINQWVVSDMSVICQWSVIDIVSDQSVICQWSISDICQWYCQWSVRDMSVISKWPVREQSVICQCL